MRKASDSLTSGISCTRKTWTFVLPSAVAADEYSSLRRWKSCISGGDHVRRHPGLAWTLTAVVTSPSMRNTTRPGQRLCGCIYGSEGIRPIFQKSPSSERRRGGGWNNPQNQMSESIDQFVWMCPTCNRRVPRRVAECRCGYKQTAAPELDSSGRGQTERARRGYGLFL